MRLIYLHGFRSSSKSFKARLLAQRMAQLGHGDRFVAPDLSPEPAAALQMLRSQLRLEPDDTLVGSSLGGSYATWLAERFGCRAVLLNPAVRPARDLASQVGMQTNFHDDAPFEFKASFVDQLLECQVVAITRPERYFLIAARGDEVLDWQEMASFYAGARQKILAGGDHGLSDFGDYQDEVLAFAGFSLMGYLPGV